MITATPVIQPTPIVAAPAARPVAGAALGRLVIPRLGLSVVFRQGTGAAVLALGPGHYMQTSLPGSGGTIGIAGHRVTHTHPFRELNRLRKGDRVIVVAGQRYVYRVFLMRIVPQRQSWPLHRRATEQIVLTACHPPRTDLRRLVVFARRVVERSPATAASAPAAHELVPAPRRAEHSGEVEVDAAPGKRVPAP